MRVPAAESGRGFGGSGLSVRLHRLQRATPTIRVEGLDIEHADREPPETSPNCRYYNSPAGWRPVPDKGMLVRAIEHAQSGA